MLKAGINSKTPPHLLGDFLTCWQQPNPKFATGFDKRSSDRGLLEIIYGCYCHAQRNQWQNAGRALIDKTYLKILWHCYCELSPEPDYTLLSQRLDNLLRTDFPKQLETVQRSSSDDELLSLIESTAIQLGLSDQAHNVSWLLFFLCPQLDIIPFSENISDWQNEIVNRLENYRENQTKVDKTVFISEDYSH